MTIARYYVKQLTSGAQALVFNLSSGWGWVAIRGVNASGTRYASIRLDIDGSPKTVGLCSSNVDSIYEILFSTTEMTNAQLTSGVYSGYGQDAVQGAGISVTANTNFWKSFTDGDPPPPPPQVAFITPAKTC